MHRLHVHAAQTIVGCREYPLVTLVTSHFTACVPCLCAKVVKASPAEVRSSEVRMCVCVCVHVLGHVELHFHACVCACVRRHVCEAHTTRHQKRPVRCVWILCHYLATSSVLWSLVGATNIVWIVAWLYATRRQAASRGTRDTSISWCVSASNRNPDKHVPPLFFLFDT